MVGVFVYIGTLECITKPDSKKEVYLSLMAFNGLRIFQEDYIYV